MVFVKVVNGNWEWLRTLYEILYEVLNVKIRVQYCNDEIISDSD